MRAISNEVVHETESKLFTEWIEREMKKSMIGVLCNFIKLKNEFWTLKLESEMIFDPGRIAI